MRFYVHVLLCLAATLSIIQAQLLPSSILCAPSTAPLITRDDCKKALGRFSTESNVVFWTLEKNSRSCGTCKISITKPSLPNSVRRAAVHQDVLTAMHQGIDKCAGKPTNATIGNFQPVSVLLNEGNGERCQ